MFEIKCRTGLSLTLPELKAFQGDLKKRSAADIDALIASIKEDGLLMPIAIWTHDDINHVLDGHARLEALMRLAIDEPEILTQPLPVLRIEAEGEEEARKALLQITSQYGRVTAKGLATFIAPISNYKVMAPVAIKVTGANVKSRGPKAVAADDEVIMRLKVKKSIVKRLATIIANVEGVEIL